MPLPMTLVPRMAKTTVMIVALFAASQARMLASAGAAFCGAITANSTGAATVSAATTVKQTIAMMMPPMSSPARRSR